jgi:ABC-type glycerol-3-phosphate transport system permease component
MAESRDTTRSVPASMSWRGRQDAAGTADRLDLVRLVVNGAAFVLLVGLCILFAFPFYFMTVASFMHTSEIFSIRPRLLPEQWQLASFHLLFAETPFARNTFNSIFIAVVETAGVVLLSAMAGYAFAKGRFPGRDRLFLFLLATMMMPAQLQIIPQYQIMVFLQWRNTYWSIIVPGLASAFGIFMLRQFIAMALPDELMSAATIDGCSFAGIFWRICLPVITPGLTVLALLTFINSWNSFLWPLLMLDRPQMSTIPIALATLQHSAAMDPIFWTGALAGTVLATLPLVIIFLAAQRFFVSGLMSGAFKGGA